MSKTLDRIVAGTVGAGMGALITVGAQNIDFSRLFQKDTQPKWTHSAIIRPLPDEISGRITSVRGPVYRKTKSGNVYAINYYAIQTENQIVYIANFAPVNTPIDESQGTTPNPIFRVREEISVKISGHFVFDGHPEYERESTETDKIGNVKTTDAPVYQLASYQKK